MPVWNPGNGGGGGGAGSGVILPWATATDYATGQPVTNGGHTYTANDEHTSGATFAGDLAAHWTLLPVTKADVGLGSVDNTPDAGKPVSAAAQTALDLKTNETTRSASGTGFVNHGATAGTSRPTGYASIEWFGSVEPTNAVNGDSWINTA